MYIILNTAAGLKKGDLNVWWICLFVICEGIRIQNLQPGQIIMDIDFRWGGDPSIILAVDAVVASLPIQVFKFGSLSHDFWRQLLLVRSSDILTEQLAAQGSSGLYCHTCCISTIRRDSLHICCCCGSPCWCKYLLTNIGYYLLSFYLEKNDGYEHLFNHDNKLITWIFIWESCILFMWFVFTLLRLHLVSKIWPGGWLSSRRFCAWGHN